MPKEKFYFTGNSLSRRSLYSAFGSMISGRKKRCLSQSHELLADYFNVSSDQIFLFSAGRMSVYALLKSLKLDSHDEVIVAGYTCVVLTNAVKFAGQPLKYVDINPENFNPNTESLQAMISERTKILILPHNFGITYQDIGKIKEEYPHLVIIEDVAHSFGSKDKAGQLCGTIGDASFFSLEYSKPVTAGMGGIMIINNRNLLPAFKSDFEHIETANTSGAMRILLTLYAMVLSRSKVTSFLHINSMRFLRRSKLGYATSKEEVEGIKPTNYPTRIHPILSCVLVQQLKDIASINVRKREIVSQYAAILSKFKSIQTIDVENAVLIRYPILFGREVSLEQINALRAEAISRGYRFGVWFNDVVHPKGSFRYMYDEGTCKVGEWVSERILNLPVNAFHLPSKKQLAELESMIRKHGIN
ncbi:DegT/DnrJ/EryC1/StrS family aminotransferase [Cryomorphaceae bacterium 1068]|nr:DegT/DnrJ/EryC1/StrS family aminotransferase [Cryomorphaceae bacterium 1068]